MGNPNCPQCRGGAEVTDLRVFFFTDAPDSSAVDVTCQTSSQGPATVDVACQTDDQGVQAVAPGAQSRPAAADAAAEVFQSYDYEPEIDRSGFLPLLQDQKLLQNQKQKLLPDTEGPVHAEAPVKTRAPVVTESHHSYFGLQKL